MGLGDIVPSLIALGFTIGDASRLAHAALNSDPIFFGLSVCSDEVAKQSSVLELF